MAEAALAETRERDKAVKALSWELDNMRKLKDDHITELMEQCAAIKHQMKVTAQHHCRCVSS